MTWRQYRPPSVDTDSKKIGDSLSMLSKRLGLGSPKIVSVIFEDWHGLVGDELGTITTPESLIDKVLTVSVADAMWLSRLKWVLPKLIETINKEVGVRAVDRIDLKVRVRGT